MNQEIAVPKDAAAVILVKGEQVLWARRNPAIKFLGGFHAFAGGKVDAADGEIKVENCAEPDLAKFIVCAVREVFEELGVLLVRGGDKLTKGQRASLHDDLISGRSGFAEILADWGLWIDARDFLYTGFWTTPQFSPVRFKTRFFIAQCPPKQMPYAAISELENIEFIAPAEALSKWRKGEVLISPPVLISLQELARFSLQKHTENNGENFSQSLRLCAESLREKSQKLDGTIDFIELNSRIICFPLRTKTLPPATHTNCFIVGRKEFIIIDAATPFDDEQAKFLAFVDSLIERGCNCRAIIVSHLHQDHFGAETVLKNHLGEKFGRDVPLLAHRITAEDLRGRVEIERFIEDEEVFYLTDETGLEFKFKALHTPGHARGHLAFYDAEFGFLLSSDNVLGAGSVVIAHPEGNMADYLASLKQMRDLPDLRFLAGSHGAAVFDARGRIEEYIAHRLKREREIIEVLEKGVTAPEEITAEVYKGLDEKLFPLALKSVLAHLVKIEADRKDVAAR